MPGPPPKRDGQRRRKNDPAAGPATKAEGARKVTVPAADAKWHPLARDWYRSLAKSGQSKFYEPSDWATAKLIAESISRELNPQPIVDSEGNVLELLLPVKGASLAGWLKAMTALMVTEGDRRRLRLELERPLGGVGEKASGNVSWLEDARRRRESG